MISTATIKELRTIFKEEFNVRLDLRESTELANFLLEFFDIALQATNNEYGNRKKPKRKN